MLLSPKIGRPMSRLANYSRDRVGQGFRPGERSHQGAYRLPRPCALLLFSYALLPSLICKRELVRAR